MTSLKSIFAVPNHPDVTYEAVARIISMIYGELPREGFFNEQKAFLLNLLNMRSRDKKISEFCLMTCLVHLNKHEDLSTIFLENAGGTMILSVLEQNTNEVQLLYYTLLNVWLLSFTENGVRDFISVAKLGVIRHICDILQKISREKLVRISFAIFKNI